MAYNGTKSAVGLNPKSLTVKKGKTAQLKGYVYYRNGKVSNSVKYKTSNSKVATINSNGKVTGKKKALAMLQLVQRAITRSIQSIKL